MNRFRLVSPSQRQINRFQKILNITLESIGIGVLIRSENNRSGGHFLIEPDPLSGRKLYFFNIPLEMKLFIISGRAATVIQFAVQHFNNNRNRNFRVSREGVCFVWRNSGICPEKFRRLIKIGFLFKKGHSFVSLDTFYSTVLCYKLKKSCTNSRQSRRCLAGIHRDSTYSGSSLLHCR